MAHSSLLFVLLLFVVGYECSHFRGGHISWSVKKDSLTVAFTVQTYWNPDKVQTSLTLSMGDGTTKQVDLPTISNNGDYVSAYGTFTYTYSSYRTYVVEYKDCCRINTTRAPIGNSNPDRLTTTINLRGVYAQSPVLSVPPVLEFGVGSNAYAFVASIPFTLSFVPRSESLLTVASYNPAGAIITSSSIPRIVQTGLANVGVLAWDTTAADQGLWALQVKATTSEGSIVSDFLVRVNNKSVNGGVPKITYSPPKNIYGLTTGQSVTFQIMCAGPDSSTYVLSTPSNYPGLIVNSGTSTSYTVNSGSPVTVTFTPTITNYADSQPYALSFTCRNPSTYLSYTDTVIVTVGKPLTLTPPPPAYVKCHPHCGCIDNVGQPTVDDGCCGNPVVTYTDEGGYGSCKTSFQRTWYAWNQCGQNVTAKQTIYVNDDIPPTFDSCPYEATVQCFYETDLTYFETPFASDTCSDTTITSTDKVDGYDSCNAVITRTFTASDECSNTATCVQKIHVRDDVPPELAVNTEAPLVVKCPSDKGFFDSIIYTIDNCGEDVNLNWTDSPAYLSCGKFTRTFVGTDRCGNKAEYPVSLEISHTEKPTFDLVEYYDTPQCKAGVKLVPKPTAYSYCGNELPVDLTTDITYTDSYDKCYTSAVRVWYAVDECNIRNEITETISIKDTIAPNLTVPADLSLECVYGSHVVGGEYAMDKCGSASATDNCGEDVTITHSDKLTKGKCTDTITRTWTATDSCHNSVSKDQTISIIDTTAPEFCTPSDFYGVCPDDIKLVTEPKDLSDCHNASFTYKDRTESSGPGKCGNAKIIRTWTAADICGNSRSVDQTIYIEDKIPPQITIPCNITRECIRYVSPDDTGYASGYDNCGYKIPGTYVDIIAPDNSYLVRVWTVVDYCGNSNTGNQTIYFNNSKPDLECPSDTYVNCWSDTYPNNTGYAAANDQCTGTLKPSYTDKVDGTCPKVITRTWSVSDPITKKTSTCDQKIYVGYYKPGPHITAPRDTTVQCEYQVDVGTGSACAAPFCPEDTLTPVDHTDRWSGTKCTQDRVLVRTWSVKDQCGKTSTADQTIHVWDNVKPTLVIPKDCVANCRWNTTVDNCGKATAWDNCDYDYQSVKVTYSDNTVPSDSHCPAQIVRTWTATDCSGNSASASQIITINERPPVFDGYPSSKLPDIECIENFHFNTLTATDSCGNKITAVAVVAKNGDCPTNITITHTATDLCGRSTVFVQYGTVKDVTPPQISTGKLTDLTVECEADVPVVGVVCGSDNCKGVQEPTYDDQFVPGNCTCELCTKTIDRTWVVEDRCGLESKNFIQRITIRKTKPPTLVVPKNCSINCGQAYTPDLVGCGSATAKDSCGAPLYVSHTDKTVTNYDGSIIIYRTWTTTDNCGRTTTAVQVITIANTPDSYSLNIPDDVTVPCGGDTNPSYSGYGTVTGKCGDTTVTQTTSQGCPQSGKLVREWTVLRNGVPVGSKKQTITEQDCPTRGYGIVNVPVAPKKVPQEGTITPHVLVSDLDLPCELLTVVWAWGDGTTETFKCDPATPDADHCKFDGTNLDTYATHSYTVAGVWKISVLIYGSRATYIPDSTGSYEEGQSYVRFSTQFVTVDPYAGSVTGAVTVQAQTQEQGYGSGYTCTQPWIRKGLVYAAKDTYADLDCNGYVQFTFGAKYKKDGNNTSVKADGTTLVTWDTCAGGFEFKSSNLTHLTLFADGHSALWTGYGKFNLAPFLGDLPFTLYAVDGGTPGNLGDYLHFRLSDNYGTVLFDTNPCAAPITDIKVQPPRPNSYITPESSGITVANPSESLVSALGTEGAAGAVPTGLIVGIVLGMMVFIVVVATVVYFLLARRSTASASGTTGAFVAM